MNSSSPLYTIQIFYFIHKFVTKDIDCPEKIVVEKESLNLIIDMVMINIPHKPSKCFTLGDYAIYDTSLYFYLFMD